MLAVWIDISKGSIDVWNLPKMRDGGGVGLGVRRCGESEYVDREWRSSYDLNRGP